MNRPSEAAITITEAAYDLQVTETDWFPRVIDATVPLIDHGLGVAGLIGLAVGITLTYLGVRSTPTRPTTGAEAQEEVPQDAPVA